VENTGTLNGYTRAIPKPGVKVPVNESELNLGPVMKDFAEFVREHAKVHVRASDDTIGKIPRYPEQLRTAVLNEFSRLRSYVLDAAWGETAQASRERAVRYWKIFCQTLSLPDVPTSVRDVWILQYFAVFMGLVWKKKDGEFGLAGTSVEQQISQVCKWLQEAYNVNVREMDYVIGKICKGLKRLDTGSMAMMVMPWPTYLFIQKCLLEEATPLALCMRDAQSMRVEMMRRVSETAETTSKDGFARGKHSRFILHHNTWLEGGDQNTIRSSNWKQLVQAADGVFSESALIQLLIGRKVKKAWYFWPKTKNRTNLTRPLEEPALLERFVNRWIANERFLAENPSYDREKLPFFHVGGRALHRREIEAKLKKLMVLAYRLHPGKGHLNPEEYSFNTHSERKCGATGLKGMGVDVEWIRWMGDWSSLAFLEYVMMTEEAALKAMVTMTAELAKARYASQ